MDGAFGAYRQRHLFHAATSSTGAYTVYTCTHMGTYMPARFEIVWNSQCLSRFRPCSPHAREVAQKNLQFWGVGSHSKGLETLQTRSHDSTCTKGRGYPHNARVTCMTSNAWPHVTVDFVQLLRSAVVVMVVVIVVVVVAVVVVVVVVGGAAAGFTPPPLLKPVFTVCKMWETQHWLRPGHRIV